jgi:S-formylglutathione hydrolase
MAIAGQTVFCARNPNTMQDGQLKPEDLEAANAGSKVELVIRMQDGYDHSYFFVSTFMEDHLRFHARALS